MSMNYGYSPESSQYGIQAVDPMWDYANDYVGADSSPVSAQQFWGFGPGFGGAFFGGPFFGGPFFRPFPFRRFGFGSPFFFRRPFWGWGGWW